MEITKEELFKMIKEEASKLKQETLRESEAVSASVNVYDVDMNSHDELGDSDKALAYKDPSKKVEKEGEPAKMPKMNQKDSDQGSDEKAAVAVKVDAGAKKGGDGHTTGQAKANFTSKKDVQSAKASGPFDDRVENLKMNSEDKLVDKEAKTYVSAGAEKGGSTHTAGQAKAEVHERMPEKDAEEPTERIAAGIEIDGSNIDLKESYTKSELKSFILSEAKKAAKNHIEKQAKDKKMAELEKELNLVMESLDEYGASMEEGWLGDWLGTSPEAKKKKLENDLKTRAKAWAKQGYLLSASVEELMKQAKEDNYEGLWGADKKEKTVIYRPADTINWKGLGLASGSGMFAGG